MGQHEDIAVVGIGCRFPGGVDGPEAYWDFLRRGGDGVVPTPPGRWSNARYFDPDTEVKGTSYVDRAGFLTQPIEDFDAGFFGISPREAATLDPQQRLLLEVAWEAFEDAGLTAAALRGSATGVFVGGFTLDNMLRTFAPQNLTRISSHTATSSSMTVLSNRLSYTFDLRGPSLTVDTACSSSLVAVHLACRALLDGECDVAVAGGVNVMLLPNYQIVMCKGHFLARDGRSKAFDARADGYGRGEGAGLVVLKPLARALADGDAIHGVIRGSGVNQDGQTDGMALPNPAAQAALIARTLDRSGVDPHSIGYVEAHGTGTRAGDPVELSALGGTYGAGRDGRLAVGSVKANFGHLEAAAGVAGLIKALLCVRHRALVPQVNFFEPNPAIDFDGWRLRIPVEPEAWPVDGPAHAAVNAFGYGGTNAHVIVSEAPKAPRTRGVRDVPGPRLFPLSARSEAALRDTARALADLSFADLDALQANLATRRSAHAHRGVAIADSAASLHTALQALAAGGGITGARTDGGLVWLYTGMGPQWWAMGAELYAADATFRRAADAADAAFQRHAGRSILADMFQDRTTSRMPRNDVAQPANFVLQVALTEVLRERGARPDAIVGHSVGEIAAAWAAGALSLDDAARVIAHRATLLQEVAGQGGMLAVGLDADALAPLLYAHPGVTVAAYNGPGVVTLSGDHDGLAAVTAALGDAAFCKPVRVEVAYHSAHMDPIRDRFEAALAPVRPRLPDVPLYSTVTAARVDTALHDAAYWWRNAREPVRLQQTLDALLDAGLGGFLEVGPHPVLASSVQACAGARMARVRTFAAMQRQADEVRLLTEAFAELWCAGFELRWAGHVVADAPVLRLPTYPWQRERMWDDALDTAAKAPVAGLTLAGEPSDTDADVRVLRLDRSDLRWLAEHEVQGQPIVPGAAFLETALASVRASTGDDTGEVVLTDVSFDAALGLAVGSVQELRVRQGPTGIALHSREEGGDWTLHARARHDARQRYRALAPVDLDAVRVRCDRPVAVDALYAAFTARGLGYGPAFRPLTAVAVGDREVVATLDGRMTVKGAFCLHPALLDGAFQALIAAFDADGDTWLPRSVARVRHVAPAGSAAVAWGRIVTHDADRVVGDLSICDADGRVLMEVTGLTCVRLAHDTVGVDDVLHQVVWVDAPVPSSSEATALHVLADDLVTGAVVAGALADAGHAVRLDGLDVAGAPGPDAHVVLVATRGLHADVLAATQALTAASVRLTVLTFGAHAVTPDVDQRALWGMFRVAMTEHPACDVRLVDLAEGADAASLATFARAVTAVDEEETVLRGAVRQAARVRAATAASLTPPPVTAAVRIGDTPVVGEVGQVGALGSLGFATVARREPGPGQVEVALDAMSLNFKDVMKAMGMLSDVALENTYLGTELGLEGAGRVVRVGSGVTRLAVGDPVFVYHGGTLRSHVVVDEAFVVHTLPAHAPEDAATLFVFLTSWYALVTRAGLRRGERVLIHSAAGGIGLSALQIARHLGAEVVATAGTAAKRDLLRRMGVAHVFDSRSLDWADDVMAATDGQGVDVVLNALAGPAMERGMACLRSGGRFVELGKQDIAAGHSLGLLPFNRSLSFLAIDLDRMAQERPEFFLPLCEEVLAAFAAGALHPLPRDVYAASDVASAFRALGSGEQIGKVVVRLQGEVVDARQPAPGAVVDPDGVTLVTGGLNGFGLATATWLADRGVRHLALASRRGVAHGPDAAAVAALRARGVAVQELALDVTDAAAVQAVVRDLDRPDRPLVGVVHAAAVIDDATLAATTWPDVARVLDAKLTGARHLDAAVADCAGLRSFVVYSSISALVGNPGQAAYAAANAGLEALVAGRRQRGLPGLAVGWGAIGGAGAVAQDARLEAHLSQLGIRPLHADDGLRALGAVLDATVPSVALVDIDWDRWAEMMSQTAWSRLQDVRAVRDEAALDDLDPAARVATITARLAEVVAGVIGLDADALDVDRPLKELGLDSIVAVEIVAAVSSRLALHLSAMEILAGRSLTALATKLATRRVEPAATAVVASTQDAAWSGPRDGGFLDRILVHPPYYAFDTIAPSDDGVRGTVRPDAGSPLEAGGLTSAEAGRHLAIAGSCAASLDAATRGAQHAYPVRRAHLRMVAPADLPAVAEAIVDARCTAFDRGAAAASATATMSSPDGVLLATLDVDYHVIPEPSFRQLFADRARPTGELSAPADTYASAPERPVSWDGDTPEVRFVVKPADCLGHFPGMPTLPVAIMGRHVFDVVAAAMQQRGDGDARFVVREARIDTHRFAFAGEEVVFRPRCDAGGVWHCDVVAAGELTAVFTLDVEAVQQARTRRIA